MDFDGTMSDLVVTSPASGPRFTSLLELRECCWFPLAPKDAHLREEFHDDVQEGILLVRRQEAGAIGGGGGELEEDVVIA
jgi:hypothetical protein